MAKGAPDYYSTVNIRLQELARLLVRPVYGSALTDTYIDFIAADSTVTLFELTGSGQIYGVSINSASPDESLASNKVDIWVDGERQFMESLLWLNAGPSQLDRGLFPVCTQYDDVDFFYTVVIPGEVTFEESFKIRYQHVGDELMLMRAYLSYAKVT